MLKLFYAPHTCALASHIALEEAGADYELARVDFRASGQKKPEYLAINPKGRVPALVTERGILTETPAILAFVAQSFPKARLAPLDDAFAFARAQAFNSYLCSTVHVAHAHRMRGYRWVDDPAAIKEMQKKVPQTVGECFALIEREMLAGPVGDGRRLHDLRPLSLHPGAVAGRRRRRHRPLSQGGRSQPAHGRTPRRAGSDRRGACLNENAAPRQSNQTRAMRSAACFRRGTWRSQALMVRRGNGPVHGHGGQHLAFGVEHRHGDADDALYALLVVQGKAGGADARELGLQVGEAGQGVRRGGLQLVGLEHSPAQCRVEVGEQHLAAGDGVRAHARADLLVQAQRPMALDALQKDVVEIVEDADIAALADVVDEVAAGSAGQASTG